MTTNTVSAYMQRIEGRHEALYPSGCRPTWSSMCEACCARLGGPCHCDCHDAQYGEPRESETLCEACAYGHDVSLARISQILYGS